MRQLQPCEHPFCSTTALPNIPLNARWTQNGVTIAGGHGKGNASNQLGYPSGLYVDDDQTILIADEYNHRIVEWKCDATSGQVVAGGNGKGNRTDQLDRPLDVIVDKETDSLIICDEGNRRVMRWSRRSRTSGETIIENIDCWSLTMDDERFLYVSDRKNHEVRRYRVGETNGTVVAGGNGRGDRLNQLSGPCYVFVDRDHSVYVSDWRNHRVMKWVKGANEGIVVAGGRGEGNALTQLSNPQGVFVDPLGTVYVVCADYWNHQRVLSVDPLGTVYKADYGNNRVMRWCNGATQGNVIVGGKDAGLQVNPLDYPRNLTFDGHGNLYVADSGNHRVQRFSIEAS
ncbi:unnamed protein product [Didymodactylos carnosus]|uniref:Uncharacterized protein n=1 Tax=Didymodactylos carnosus TaxID=1234261 RepID=A0A8S2E065_9BILA|nr:unnamed protein product [Didymodactylos carnosus]CAF3859208.1 unnamed protein product [Didymodactylos carnosus]